jgi:MFS family permease
MSEVAAGAYEPFVVTRAKARRVIIASSAGTVFEWYDFFIFAVLAPFFATLFFPPGNDTAALLSAFGTYAVGFVARPFGAFFLGRLGDVIGRKVTFLISIIFMGFSTFTIGLLPTFAQIGWLAPVLLVVLRLIQGVAVGGEYGGAATYVAEYSPAKARGYTTSWIQTTATIGLLLALLFIGLSRSQLSEDEFQRWGWRLPFLVSIFLLALSVYIRVRMDETPVFRRLQQEGRRSISPIWESLTNSPNNRYLLHSLFGVNSGHSVIWYTAHFYALYFLIIILKLDYLSAYALVGCVLALSMPLFVVFGWLSDKVGRLKIILAGFLLAALTYFPLFELLSSAVNPALAEFQARHAILLKAQKETCHFHLFVGPWSRFSTCDQVTDALRRSGLSFEKTDAPGSNGVVLSIGTRTIEIAGEDKVTNDAATTRLLFESGYPDLVQKVVDGRAVLGKDGYPVLLPSGANPAPIGYFFAGLVLFALMLYATMVYGPVGAFLVELFPARVRYTSTSVTYHVGAGIFGGMLPFVATAIVAYTGNIYAGLWYPVTILVVSFIVGALFLRDQMERQIHD